MEVDSSSRLVAMHSKALKPKPRAETNQENVEDRFNLVYQLIKESIGLNQCFSGSIRFYVYSALDTH